MQDKREHPGAPPYPRRKTFDIWFALIFFFSVISIAIIYYGISIGTTNLTSYLFLIPIIFVANRYPERGIAFSFVVGLLLVAIYYPLVPTLEDAYLIFVNSVVLVGTGTVTSLLSRELSKEKGRYESIFTTSQAGILLVDKKTLEIKEVNDRFARMVSFTPAGLEGHSLSLIWEDFTEMERFFSVISDIQTASDVETRFKTRNGKTRDFLISVGAGFGSTFVLTATDITDRKIAEKEREQERIRARTYLNTAGVMLFVVRSDHLISLVNYKCAEVLGFREAELMGRNWFENFVPREYRDMQRRKFNAIISGSSSIGDEFEHPVMTPKGERIIAGHFTPLREGSGLIASVLFSAEDVTEARQMQHELILSEENYRTLFEAGSAATAILEHDGTLSLVNSRFERMTGYSKYEVEGRMKWNDFLYEEGETPDYAVPLGGEPFGIGAPIEYEMRIKNRKGEPRDIVVTTSPIPQTSRYVTSILDITRRKQSEDELRASLKEKEVLLKEVHHRVKNNMQVISSLVSLQSDKISDVDMLERLRETENRVKSMALVHESLYQSENLAEIDPAKYLKILAEEVISSYALETEVELEFDIDVELLDIDTALPCGLIINELVSNSLKHGFKGREHGTISIAMHEVDKEYLLTVKDDGVGLPPDFDVTALDSLGIRLINVLTRQMRGTIAIETGGPGGSFTFHIPSPKR
jgi:PAS domain S-box-containing protein